MMPVPGRNWQVRVQFFDDPKGRPQEGTIRLSLVLPTLNDIIQITDFKRLLRGTYHDAYRVTEVGLGEGSDRMVLKMARLRKDVDLEMEKAYTPKPTVYSLGAGSYIVDISLDPGGQIAQRKKIPAIPLLGDFFRMDDGTQFVGLDDPGFGSGSPQYPVVLEPGTLLRVVAAYHSWTWLRPGTLRDGTPRFDITQTRLSTRTEAIEKV